MELETISARLLEARTAQDKTIEDISAATHIGKRYLKAIESGDWEELREVYAVGYVREYARALNLPDAEDMARLFNIKFSHPAKLPLVDSMALPGSYSAKSKGLPRKQGRKRRMSGRSMKIPGLLVAVAAGAIIYFFSFSSVPDNDKERLRQAYNDKDITGHAEPDALPVKKTAVPKKEKQEPRVPVAYALDTAGGIEERSYILHSETNTTIKVYNAKHRMIESVPLAAGDVAFVTVPENGYAAAANDPDKIIVYTDDMQENLGDMRVLSPKQR